MKLSEWINALQSDVEHSGDRELDDMPDGWKADVIPDELCRWLLLNNWLEFTLLPDGVFVPGVVSQDPEDDEIEKLGVKLEDAAVWLARDRTDGELIIAAMENAIAAVRVAMEAAQ